MELSCPYLIYSISSHPGMMMESCTCGHLRISMSSLSLMLQQTNADEKSSTNNIETDAFTFLFFIVLFI